MKELSHGSLLPEDFSKKRSVLKKVAIRLVPVSVLIFAGCSGGGGVKNSSFQELENRESGYSLPFPEGETWFLTNGPHGDGSSNEVRNAIDIAPPEGGFCPPDGRKFTIDNRVVTASASGEVTIKGNDKNRDDPFHSIVDIKDNNGLTQRFVHLDNTKVKLGDKVKQGNPLGNPSCEFPPGGANTGPHVHIGLMKDGRAIPIAGIVVGGWTIHGDGTMTKPGEQTRTADVGRFGENSTGIRNDLPNNPNKAVVASPKHPIPPISSTITSKEVLGAAATPAPKPAETHVQKEAEKAKEQWQTFKSSVPPYEIQYPASWKNLEDDGVIVENGSKNSTMRVDYTHDLDNRIDSGLTLETFVEGQAKAEPQPYIKITKRIIAGLDAQTITTTRPTETTYRTFLIVSEGDGFPRLWVFASFNYSTTEASNIESERIYNRFLDSFKLLPSATTSKEVFTATRTPTPRPAATEKPQPTPTPKPTETQKPAVEKKVSISKKPEELYRALLTNPISPDVLPQGMTSRGASASEIDATGKALKQVGAVTIKIEDSVSTVAKGTPNGGISYAIFPDSSGAKSASEVVGTHFGDGQALKDFPYPTKIYTIDSFFGITTRILITSVENVVVMTLLTGNAKSPADLVQSRTISLGHAAIEHLRKVGK